MRIRSEVRQAREMAGACSQIWRSWVRHGSPASASACQEQWEVVPPAPGPWGLHRNCSAKGSEKLSVVALSLYARFRPSHGRAKC
uniref:Uncharacterized protein n=1 Tax=Cairina moschata TaxID=8855 RepID=A0A8C3BZ35_CAIMO